MGDKKWESYEEVARFLLDQMAAAFKLEYVEGKQTVAGLRSGTEYEIDAKGVAEGGQAFIIVECRRHTKNKIVQEQVGGLAYRILDTGASGGIIVSPLGLQKGAAKIAEAERIVSVKMDKNSTCTDFILGFLNQLFIGVSDTIAVTDRVTVVVTNTETGAVK